VCVSVQQKIITFKNSNNNTVTVLEIKINYVTYSLHIVFVWENLSRVTKKKKISENLKFKIQIQCCRTFCYSNFNDYNKGKMGNGGGSIYFEWSPLWKVFLTHQLFVWLKYRSTLHFGKNFYTKKVKNTIRMVFLPHHLVHFTIRMVFFTLYVQKFLPNRYFNHKKGFWV
jgi:hypothetical protein